MPCCANITALNLMLKPILRMPADSSTGRSAASASAALIWSGASPGIEQPGAAAGLLVAERDVAGIVGPERQRDAADFGLHRVDLVGLGLDRDMAGIVDPRDPGVQLIEAAMVWYLLRSTGSFARGFGACGGERHRRALEACGLVLLVGAPVR